MKLVYLVVIYTVFVNNIAYAYLDPGTLAMIFSIIAGLFASTIIFFKNIINKIKVFFKKKKKE
tara:strand:+ start:53 stop:241 length:189 start_codon:yes stop_codon:yes gene_type:complete